MWLRFMVRGRFASSSYSEQEEFFRLLIFIIAGSFLTERRVEEGVPAAASAFGVGLAVLDVGDGGEVVIFVSSCLRGEEDGDGEESLEEEEGCGCREAKEGKGMGAG